MIDAALVPSAFTSWEPLLEPLFQPDLNNSVSAVCLFHYAVMVAVDGVGWRPLTKLVINPHAAHPLPAWITQVVAADSTYMSPWRYFNVALKLNRLT